jgi:hypothetical protein
MPHDTAEIAWVQRVLGVAVASVSAGSQPDLDAVRKRFGRLEPAFLRVVRVNPPERTKMSAIMGIASEALAAGDIAKASAALDQLEKLLGPIDGPARPVVNPTEDSLFEVTRGDGQLVAYRKVLLQWDAAKKQANSQITGLKAAIARRYPVLAKSVDILDGVMQRLNLGLSNALNAAINAADPSERADCHERAARLARDYLMKVNFSPEFRLVDQNPVQPLTLRAELGTALKQLVAALPV